MTPGLDEIPNLVNWIRQCWDVSDESLAGMMSHTNRAEIPRRTRLVEAGRYMRAAFFVEQGITRSYWVVNGEEITTSFSTEGSIVFSMDEVYYNRPSEEYVESIEPLRVYAIGLDILREIVTTDIEIANWWRVIHQNEYRRLHRSHKERLTLPASERYDEFERQFPDVCLRARLSDIASYLGINQSTLSRIRARRRL